MPHAPPHFQTLRSHSLCCFIFYSFSASFLSLTLTRRAFTRASTLILSLNLLLVSKLAILLCLRGARVSERVNPFAKNAYVCSVRPLCFSNKYTPVAAGQRVGERRVIKRQFRFAPFCAWATVDEYLKLQISPPARKAVGCFIPTPEVRAHKTK
jgi:hypothetical protein